MIFYRDLFQNFGYLSARFLQIIHPSFCRVLVLNFPTISIPPKNHICNMMVPLIVPINGPERVYLEMGSFEALGTLVV
jgi:hypothetical protein